jgi:uncharacterized protein (TIGR00369 family)
MANREFARDDLCFVCGRDNAGGLRLDPSSEDGRALLEWTPEPTYQGYAGVLHGGIISTLLDETMAHAVLSRVGRAPTVEIDVQFLKLVRTGVPLRVTAVVLEQRKRIVIAEAELVQDGEVRARASGKFIVVPKPAGEA